MPIDHFDLLAPIYDRIIKYPDTQSFIKIADLPVEGNLLDAGGGTGRVSEKLVGLAGRLVVADLSSGMLHEASRKNGLQPVRSRTENLPFPEEFFERVIMVDALHHVYDQRKTAIELWRVLARKGFLVIVEPDINKFLVRMVALAEKMAFMRSRFLGGEAIADFYSNKNASVNIIREKFNVWVVVEKR